MENPWTEMRRALDQSRSIVRAVKDNATPLAYLLEGSLRDVGSTDLLRKLKRELRAFDMVMGKWKDRR